MLEYNFIKFGTQPDGFVKPIGLGERFPFYPTSGEELAVLRKDGTLQTSLVSISGNVATIQRLNSRVKVPDDGECCRLARYTVSEEGIEGYADGDFEYDQPIETPEMAEAGHPFSVNIEYFNVGEEEEGYVKFYAVYEDDTKELLKTLNFDHGVFDRNVTSFDVPALPNNARIQAYSYLRGDGWYDTGQAGYIEFDFYQEWEEYDIEYSNDLMWTSGINENEDEAFVEFKCDKDEFGFPFSTCGKLATWLPIRIKNPQYKQEDEKYVKTDGKVVTLYSKHYKEWDGETEYMPESMHDKVMVVLSCDEVYVNEVLLTKSDEYNVDWENYDTTDYDVKTARATFKMQANTNNRNSNY